MNTETLEFSIGQNIVYPSQGVGRITEIFERTLKEERRTYYKIYLEASDMNVMIPVENTAALGIRPIVSAEEARATLENISSNFEPVTSDWKLRYQMNMDLLKKGSIGDIATIVRGLYYRGKIKELPIQERKLYDNAKKLLEDELSYALGIPFEEVEAMLHAKLEPLGMSEKPKHIISRDDDDDDDEFLDEDEADDVDSSDDSDDDDDEEPDDEDASDDDGDDTDDDD